MSKPGTHAPWRPAKLSRRRTHTEQQLRIWKRSKRGGNTRPYVIDSFVGRNHRQGPRKLPAARAPLILLAPNTPKQRPAERPATRPSWAIMANKRRKGLGYSGSPSDWESL